MEDQITTLNEETTEITTTEKSNAGLGYALLIGGGTLLGVGLKTAWDKFVSPRLPKKEDVQKKVTSKKSKKVVEAEVVDED